MKRSNEAKQLALSKDIPFRGLQIMSRKFTNYFPSLNNPLTFNHKWDKWDERFELLTSWSRTHVYASWAMLLLVKKNPPTCGFVFER